MSSVASAGLSSGSIALRLMQSAAASGKSGVGVPTSSSEISRADTMAVDVRLSAQAIAQAFGADSEVARIAAGSGEDLGITVHKLIPDDKEAFKGQVLAWLQQTHPDDKSFVSAVKSGTLVINTADEVPELNIQPDVGYTLYRDGYSQGGGIFTPKGMNTDLYEQLGQSRRQSYGGLNSVKYYAYWPA